MTATTSISTQLAAHRLQPFLSQVRKNDSDSEVIRAIVVSRYTVSSFMTTGPAYDLQLMLQDPTFTLPGRSRSATEAIVAESRERVDELLALTKEQDRQTSNERTVKLLLITAVLGGTILMVSFALPAVLQVLMAR